MYRQRNSLGGLTGGIFLIGLALAFFIGGGHFFLSILFATLAFCSLFGSLATLNPRGFYGGLQGFVWLLGLGILFLPGVGFWPWILVLCGISAILGVPARLPTPSTRSVTRNVSGRWSAESIPAAAAI